LVDLAQGEGIVWHALGMPEDGCGVLIASLATGKIAKDDFNTFVFTSPQVIGRLMFEHHGGNLYIYIMEQLLQTYGADDRFAVIVSNGNCHALSEKIFLIRALA